MKTILIALITLACLPTISYGQDDFEDYGQDDFEDYDEPSGNRPRSAPAQQSPNSSGNMNPGGFQDNNLFGPPDGGFNDGSNLNYNNNFRPQNNFPQNNSHQGFNHYPSNNMTPGYNQYPGSFNSNNSMQTYPGTSRPVYSDPPVAPKVYSNLPIVIQCAPDCAGTCSYSLLSGSGRSFPYTIRSGQTQKLKESTDWKFSYKPDGGTSQTYALRGGRTYELRQNGDQWRFYLVP